MAWVRGFGDSSEIMLHDLATGTTTHLTSNSYLDDYPCMGAHELVWNTGNDSPPNDSPPYVRGVHLLDFTTGMACSWKHPLGSRDDVPRARTGAYRLHG